MSDEPTAIRAPGRKWHRAPHNTWTTDCRPNRITYELTERAPLSQTAPEDRCRICWPAKEEA